jgi:hypothetical protein
MTAAQPDVELAHLSPSEAGQVNGRDTVIGPHMLRVAEKGLYRPLWSGRILAEAQAATEEIHPGIDAAKRFAQMREAFDDALVSGREELEGGALVRGKVDRRRHDVGRRADPS